MTVPKMTVPLVRGDTPFERFVNALKTVLAAPKVEVVKKTGKKTAGKGKPTE